MAVALAGQLREGTKKSHTMAENTGFVACFLKGVVEKKSYRKLISDLYFVYQAMEEEIERLVKEEHPVIKPIGFKSLFRTETLENDLKFYFGDDWKNEINISKSAEEYVKRIHLVAQTSPELLVGHHYTRYIGDLSGGQILKKIAKKALNLDGNNGLNFYEFKNIGDEKKFKEEYSKTLNQLPINQTIADEIIDEANKAFTYNMKMFKELEGNLIGVLGKIVFNYLTKKVRKGSTET
ncbi:Heme oxygenase [Prochlorococcus marinus str. MIT 9515]|uniref:heme oxygenase (biliverdin-producing) n=1 Tax=Prochlorococcus marinus (strain MIT 9515) TaxID=167542 RepID=A2BYX7_PROM5|nr:heme oxygenase (biliverdin-producing) [Prochlorococcus marinus]ABM72988.1 Heme oxygenase [Prochlorococcus marinus str. MIT 9515]